MPSGKILEEKKKKKDQSTQ